MSPEIIIDKPDGVPEALARRFEDEARRAVEARGRFAVALPGGSVASACFPRLALSAVEWTRTEFFWGDERAVPAEDPDSNYRLARSLWLDRIPVDEGRVHRMRGELDELEAAAAEYEADLVRTLGDPPRLDLAILGVGQDGHVCSLFPGHRLLKERTRRVAAVRDSPKPPPRRLTLTMPTLLAARGVAVVALGAAKAGVVKAALEDRASELPVALVARGAPRVVFLLDPGAASLLARADR